MPRLPLTFLQKGSMGPSRRSSSARRDPVGARFAVAPLALALSLSLGVQQSASAQAAAAARAISITAQPLSQALTELARQTGATLVASPALLADKAAPAVSGQLTPQQALDQLLAGSGLAGSFDGGVLTVQRAPGSGETSLPAVKVTAQTERAGTTEGSGSYTTDTMSSATHLPLTLRETLQSVTVLTSARIAADNLVDLVDIAKSTPGLSIQSSDVRPYLQSRGYEVDSVTQDGIAVRYDAYAGDSLGNLAMQDRVEVVRGATGLMQGSGNPSAAVNMIRKRPTSAWQFKGSASAGSWDDYRLTADVSGPLAADGRVRGRVVGYVQNAGDYYDLAFNDKRLGYATVDVDLTERTTLNIGYSHLYSNKNLTWGALPTNYAYRHLDVPRSTFAGADWEYNKNKADTVYASLAHDLGAGWNLNANATYVDGHYDILATYLIPTPDVGGYGHVWWATQTTRKQKAIDVKLSGPVTWFGRQHDLVLGATVNRQKGRIAEWWQGWDAPLTSGVDLSTWNHVAPRPDTSSTSPWLLYFPGREKQDSLYSAGKFNVADPLDVLVGARLDWFNRTDPWSGASYSQPAHLTKYLGLVWAFAAQHSAYLSYTDVFQPQNARDLSGKLLPPKSGRNYEVGVKGEYLDGTLNASLALFRIDENNRAVYLSDQTGCPVPSGCFAAAGLVRTEGVDLELQGALTPDWQVGTGVTWSETRYRKDINPDNVGTRLNTGDPTTLFKLSTQYTLPGALDQLTLGGRVNWQSRMYADRENADGDTVRNQQGARAVLDLSATYRFTKHLSAKLDVNNVFDKVYYSTISYDWYWGANETYGRPRSVLLTLNASY